MTDKATPSSPGWYPDPEQVQTLRYWDGHSWTEQRAPIQPEPVPRSWRASRTLRAVVGAIIGIVLFLYLGGHLDHLLYPVGLNINECAKNGFGSVYCGKELDEYRKTVEQPIDSAQQEFNSGLERFEAEQEAERLLGR